MYQFMGNYSQADYNFETALKKNPRLYVPNLFLGLNRLRVHQAHAALPYLKSAVALNSQDEQAPLGLAHAYTDLRDDSDASRWFERALEINPQDSDAWYALGISYLNLQDDAVTRLKKLDPDNVYARVLVADAFLEQGRTEDAIQIYERFQTQNRPPCLKSQLGLAYAQTGALEKAKEILQRQAVEDSGCLSTNVALARIALSTGNSTEMLRQLRWVDDRNPQFLSANIDHLWKGLGPEAVKRAAEELQTQPWAQDVLAAIVEQSASLDSATAIALQDARAKTSTPANKAIPKGDPRELWAQGRYDACASKLRATKVQMPAPTSLLEQCSFYAAEYPLTLHTSEQILQTTPSDFEALYWQAKSAQHLSVNAFARMSAAAPNSPKVHLLMARLHRARQEYPAAEAEYAQVLRASASADEQTTARLGLAHVYFRDSEDDKALEELRAVLTADSSNADAHGLMGELLVRQHKFEDAFPHLKLALHGASDDSRPELHSLLAKCYAQQGDYPEAVKELEPALPADTMGAFHYQLYQLYQKMGDQKAAQAALQKSEQLRQQKARAEQQHTLRTSP
jgi:tetratricopeptide (TPR) repeat protein